MNFVFRSPARGGVPGRVGSLVQREHRGPDREEGHGTDQQRRRPPRPKPQPQDPHAPEPPLSRVAFFPSYFYQGDPESLKRKVLQAGSKHFSSRYCCPVTTCLFLFTSSVFC